MREFTTTMRWYERIAAAFDASTPRVNRAKVGRELGITGQAITQKLQGKRPTYVEELEVMARWAGMTVAEALGDDAVVIEIRDEMDLVKLYRLMTPEQRERFMGMARDAVAASSSRQDEAPSPP
jgi:hypothetical protein